MKTIKVIDLLNKIANGEEVPKKIKYKNITWYFNKKDKTYYMNNTQIELFYIENLSKKLNDKVEIIEEEKKIPEKIKMRVDSIGDINNKIENLNLNQMIIEDKINEIIDYLEELK